MDRERRGSSDYRRTNYILGLVKKGLPPDQIDRQLEVLDSQTSRGRIGRDRGLGHEVRVQRLLQKAPYVESIDRTNAYSPEDRAGYDLYVYLRGIDQLDAVGVQVKSSQRGINEFFRERVNPYLRRRGEKGVRRWLVSRRLVMINGSLTETEIIESFVGQVEEIARRARLEQSQ